MIPVRPRFTSSARLQSASRAPRAALLLVAAFAWLLTGLPRDARAFTGQYRGPVGELREFFRGVNPRLRPPIRPTGPSGTGGLLERRRVPPVGADGQGYLRWEFWWEHNKDRYLGLWNYHNRESSTVVRGGADFLLGGTVKDRVPVIEALDATTREEVILPVLLRGIRSTDVGVRAASWIALGKIGSDLSAESFTDGVNDRDPDVQMAALLGLGFLGKPEGIPLLVKAMHNGKRKIRARMAAAFGLAFVDGAEAANLLLSYLGSVAPRASGDVEEMSIALLKGLAIHGDRSSVEPLQKLLRSARGADTDVRAALYSTLGLLGDRSSIEHLVRGLKDRSIPVRRACAIGLGEIDVHTTETEEELARLLAHRERWRDSAEVSEDALRELDALIEEREKASERERKDLDKHREIVSRALIEAIREDNDVQVRNYACISLAKVGGKGALATLFWAFNTGFSHALQSYGALGLGILGDPAASPALLERLSRPGYESHRGAVAIALGLLRERSAIPSLTTIVLYQGLDPDLRGYAAQAIGLIGDRDLVPDLHRLLEREKGNEELLRGVAIAVGLLGDRGSIQPLGRLLFDPRNPHTREVRGAATIALGLIRDKGAVEPLVDLLAEPLPGEQKDRNLTRAFAAAALGYVGDPQLIPEVSGIARDHDYRMFVQGLDSLLLVL